MKLSRRKFLKYGVATIGAGTVLGATGHYASNQFLDTTEVIDIKISQVKINSLPDSFHGFKIGFISDVHLGPFVASELLEKAISLVNQYNPDIVVLGGDHLHLPNSLISRVFDKIRNPEFPDRNEKHLARRILKRYAEMFQSINSKHGIIAIPGNHDNSNAHNIIAGIFNKANLRYLNNEAFTLKNGNDSLEFFAVDDYWTGIPITPNTVDKKNTARILLAHNPDYISNLLRLKNIPFDLALAGHTHAGQICPAISHPLLTNVYDQKLVHGLILDKKPIIVSAGIGVVDIPWRINCPGEVNIVELLKA